MWVTTPKLNCSSVPAAFRMAEPRSPLPRLPTVSLPQATRHLLSQSFSQNSYGEPGGGQRGR